MGLGRQVAELEIGQTVWVIMTVGKVENCSLCNGTGILIQPKDPYHEYECPAGSTVRVAGKVLGLYEAKVDGWTAYSDDEEPHKTHFQVSVEAFALRHTANLLPGDPSRLPVSWGSYVALEGVYLTESDGLLALVERA